MDERLRLDRVCEDILSARCPVMRTNGLLPLRRPVSTTRRWHSPALPRAIRGRSPGPGHPVTRAALQELLAPGAAMLFGWSASPDACCGGCPVARRVRSQWFQVLIADGAFGGRTGLPALALAQRRFCAGSLTDGS